MSFSSKAYLGWAERQFEQTGIENDYFSSVNFNATPFRKYKRDNIGLTPLGKSSVAEIDIADIERKKRNQFFGINDPADLAHEEKIDQYHKDCETIGNEAAKEKYLKNA